ncbi:hypothetical protein HS125_07935 [bacterium]|nr:hypothetical protein [bacterium]
MNEWIAFGLDLCNPLSVFQDIADVMQLFDEDTLTVEDVEEIIVTECDE